MSDPNPTSSYDPNEPQSYRPAADPQDGYAPHSYAPATQGSGAYARPYGVLPEHPQGTAVLVLGIVGLFVTICAPIAWYLGRKAQKEMAASGVRYSNEQNIAIGKVLGMVVSILAMVGIVIAVIIMVIVVIAAVATGAQ